MEFKENSSKKSNTILLHNGKEIPVLDPHSIEHKQYSILRFAKNHPATAIAIISGFYTLLLLLSNSYGNFTSQIILNYWKIDLNSISLNDNNHLYVYVIKFVFLLITSLYFCAIFLCVEHQREYSILNYYRKETINAAIRDCRVNIKYYNKTRSLCKKAGVPMDNELSKDSLRRTLKEAKIIKKENRKVSVQMTIYEILIIMTPAVIVEFIISSLYFSTAKITYNNYYMIFLYSLLFVIGATIYGIILYLILHRRNSKEKKRIKEAVKNDDVITHNKMFFKTYANTRVDSIFKHGIIPLFKDSAIIIAAVSLIMMFILLFIFNPFIVKNSEDIRKEFYIYTDTDQTHFAIVYSNAQSVIMEEAEILDQELVIHTNIQRQITPNDLELTKQKFDKVTLIETDLTKSTAPATPDES